MNAGIKPGPEPPLPHPGAPLPQRLRAHVHALAGAIGERHAWRPAALHAAAHYIRRALADAGCDVQAQAYEDQGLRCENLEVTLAGGDARLILLVGAHYDTVPGSPGADDNASGVAGLIEMARALRALPLGCTVRLVAFVNEEPPFFFTRRMGSSVYARAARLRGDDIRLMLSLEMIGCYSAEPRSQGYPPLLRHFYPERGDFIAFVSNLRSRHALRKLAQAFRSVSDFPAERLASPAFVPGVAWSDQLSFWRAGYPAVMVTDTAFYRNPRYHSALDTPDTLDYAAMARVVDGLTQAVQALSNEAS